MVEKECKICLKVKPVEEFYPNKQGVGGYDCYCKVCRYEYHRSRKEIINAHRRERMHSCSEYRDKVLQGKRESHKRNLEQAMLNRAKRRAIQWNLEFTITISDIVIPEICPLLEIPIIPGKKGDYANTPSLDRIDNTKGYTKDNIRVISMLANIMKNSATPDMLFKFVRNIPNYLQKG